MTAALLALLLAAADAGLPPGRVVVTADRLTWRKPQGRVTYAGNARAVRGATTLTCDTLEGFLDARDEVERLQALGRVHAVEGEREAWGEQADYDPRTGVLVVVGEPRGRAGVREVTGVKVTFVSGLDELTVEKPHTVSGGEQAGGGGPVTIDADSLVLRQGRATAVWRGHVRATRGKTVLTAPELEATWDASGAVTRLVARGGVTAVEPGRSARGERADFDVSRGVVVVTGHPEARQGNNRVQGSRVTFTPGTDRLEVEQATTVIQREPRP